MNECDLILALGSSFSNHTGVAPYKPIIQVDFERMQLGRFHPVDIAGLGRDRRLLRRDRAARDAAGGRAGSDRASWSSAGAIWRAEKEKRRLGETPRSMVVHSAAALFDALNKISARSDAIIAGRCRQQHLLLRPLFRTLRNQRDADVGLSRLDRLRLAGGDRRLGGDAGFPGIRRPQGDLHLRRWRLRPIRHGVQHGCQIRHEHHAYRAAQWRARKISKEQRAGEWDVWETSLTNPSFAAFARLCGGMASR